MTHLKRNIIIGKLFFYVFDMIFKDIMNGNLVNEIVSAMETGELQAYYQPQYNIKKGVIGGAEALVRWVKSDGTVILPKDFIPYLEAEGNLSVVDWFIAEEACKTIASLGDKAVRISVNFGREHAHNANFVEMLDNLVKNYGIGKELLGIEITESDIATSRKAVIKWVNKIEAAGYTVYIDDFGYGMSSLSFVKDVPAKVLKIDRSFLNDNCQSEKGRQMLESVFYMAHRLKLVTVVEGVETDEQLQFINTCDCDLIQGFIFSKPVPKNDFLNMCMEDTGVEIGDIDPFATNSVLGQIRMLIDSVYKKFQLIKFVNISKNSYTFMKRENFMDLTIPETGWYDDSLKTIVNMTVPESREEIQNTFNRESLIEAYKRGEKRVMRIVNQIDDDGALHKVAIEDFFIDNQVNDDIFIVSFFQTLDFPEGTYA